MRIPFVLLSTSGTAQTNKSGSTVIQTSKDGAAFTTLNVTPVETGSGCYYVDLSEAQLSCTHNVLIRVTCPNCQTTLLEYTPDPDPSTLAEAVWSADSRTLTSLNTGSQPATRFTTSSRTTPSTPQRSQGLSVRQIIGGRNS